MRGVPLLYWIGCAGLGELLASPGVFCIGRTGAGADTAGVGRAGVGTEHVSGVGTEFWTKEGTGTGTGTAGVGWAGIEVCTASKEFRCSEGAGPDDEGEGIGTSSDSAGAI